MIPKVSIVVPIYNADIYLKECLDSLINQTLKDLEIILVLDCPSDGSNLIAEEYAQKDTRIKIIQNKTNLHIGESRNEGLKVATGEYIGFSDHDDFREPTMYEILYNKAKLNNLDMLVGVTVDFENGNKKEWTVPDYITDNDIKEFALRDLISNGSYQRDIPLFVNIHPNLYRNEIIKGNHLCFVDTRHIVPEDRLFNIQFLLHSKHVGIERKKLYYHRILQESEGHKTSYLSSGKRLLFVNEVYHALKQSQKWIIYESDFYIGAGKVFMDQLLSIIISEKNITKFIKTAKVMKQKEYTKSVFMHYSWPKKSLWWVKWVKKAILLYMK